MLRSPEYDSGAAASAVRSMDDDAQDFLRVFLRHASRIGVPLNVDAARRSAADCVMLYVTLQADSPAPDLLTGGRTFSFRHEVFGRDLPPLCWRLLDHVRDECGRRVGRDVTAPFVGKPWVYTVAPK